MYRALDVAEYVIYYCKHHDKHLISNFQLQKILYFIQAEFLVSKGEPCFYEDIEAWDLGPVVPTVYKRYIPYGGGCIPGISGISKLSCVLWRNEEDKQLIHYIVDECNGYSASSLAQLTQHQEPWLSSYKPGKKEVISNESIRDYFKVEVATERNKHTLDTLKAIFIRR